MLRIFRGERRSAPTANSTDEAGADVQQPPGSPEDGPASAAGMGADGLTRDGAPASQAGALREEQSMVGIEERAAAGAEQATDEHHIPPPSTTAFSAPPSTTADGRHAAASSRRDPDTEAPSVEGAPPQGAAAGQSPQQEPPGDPGFLQRGRMRRRARFLRAARELAYRDLGGLVFDLQRFGARNDDVVGAKLATLGRIDSELRAIEEALRLRSPVTVLREAGVAACPRCAAIHGSDDRFCPACGLGVVQAERPIGAAAGQAPAPPSHQAAAPGQYQPVPAPHQPAPHLPAPHLPAPHLPALHQPAPHQPAPHQPAPHQPAPQGQPDGQGQPDAQRQPPPFPYDRPGPQPEASPSEMAPEQTSTKVVSPEGGDDMEQRTRALDPVPSGALHDVKRQTDR